MGPLNDGEGARKMAQDNLGNDPVSRRSAEVRRGWARSGPLVATVILLTGPVGCGGSSGQPLPARVAGQNGQGSGGISGAGGSHGSGGVGGSGGVMGSTGGMSGAAGSTSGSSGGAAAGGHPATSGVSGMGGSSTGGSQGGSTGTGGPATGGSGTAGKGSGGSGSGGAGGARAAAGGAGGAASTSTLLVDLAKAFCAAARSCCLKKGLPTALDDCEARFPSRLWGLPYVDKGSETIDTQALASCIAGYQETASTCAFQPLEAACKNVFVGTKNEGATCGKGGMSNPGGSGECKMVGRATVCLWTGDSNVSTTTGVCLNPAHGKKGDPCASSCARNDSCIFDLFTSPGYPTLTCFEEDGLYCASGGDSMACAPLVPTGGDCGDDSQSCASTDYCDYSGGTPKCRTAATLGQSCSFSNGPDCARGMSLSCGTSNKCEDLGFAYETTCSGTPPFP